MVPLAHPNPLAKQHFDLFNRFSTARVQQTDKHTDRPRYTFSNRPHLCTMCMRCGLKSANNKVEPYIFPILTLSLVEVATTNLVKLGHWRRGLISFARGRQQCIFIHLAETTDCGTQLIAVVTSFEL